MQRMEKLFFIVIIILITGSTAFGGDINGTIGIIMKSGDIKYGARVKLYLTTKEIAVPNYRSNYKKQT